MPVYLLDDSITFPHPSLAREDGLLAVGGDLRPERLALAYSNGIFPWYNQGESLMWWAPNPRYVIYINEYKASKNLTKLINKDKFQIKFNVDFDIIIDNCSNILRKEQDGTWLGKDMINAYKKLKSLGIVISVGVYQNDKLVAGLYGVELKHVFCGESMFHTVSDAGNIAFYYLVEYCKQKGIELIDAQMHTQNMENHGGEQLSFSDYEKYLHKDNI